MGSYINDRFLLNSKKGYRLYRKYARDMPIFDYHSHLPAGEIAENKRFRSITELWLAHDHYKWRAMRTCGVQERFITGDAGDFEKFMAFATTIVQMPRNPLYQWCHMELATFFGIDNILLSPETAELIYNRCNSFLEDSNFTTRKILEKMNVKTLFTTDDPVDDLSHHRAIRNAGTSNVEVLPTFRPDNALKVEDREGFLNWIEKLVYVTGIDVSNLNGFLDALKQRHDYFDSFGCRASDHGIDRPYSSEFDERRVDEIFKKLLSRKKLSSEEAEEYKSFMMYFFASLNAEKGWVMQLHIGASRNNNTRYFRLLGPDSGFDSIGDYPMADRLVRFLDRLDIDGILPKMVIFNLNPSDNELIVSIIGSFQGGDRPGKLQYGPAWWFNDTKRGIINQLNALSELGVLGKFIGMVTDSRSFLSFVRHDYFRRILCNMIGEEIESGDLPDNEDLFGNMISNICYKNAVNYFSMESS